MKLDANILRYITREEIRVLTAIEMGMKNHEVVPTILVQSIAKLKRGGTFKTLQSLLKYKLIIHSAKDYDGYTLGYHGYDILALHCFFKRGVLRTIGSMIGTGKESDIYHCEDPQGNQLVVKLARLGRTSFKAVKNKRDYLGRRSKNNWLYMSRLAAIREFGFMTALYEEGLPTPSPVAHNRHAILMSLLPAYPLINVRHMQNPGTIFNFCVELAVKLLELGLVHCDFNQFNLLVGDDESVYLIDFPQMVSSSHFNAKELFYRDLDCLNKYFSKRFRVECEELPEFEQVEVVRHLDTEIKASGYLRDNLTQGELSDLDYVAEGEDEDAGESGEEGETENTEEYVRSKLKREKKAKSSRYQRNRNKGNIQVHELS